MVKKNDIIEVAIEDVLFPNKGIAKINDKKIIIKDTLKGQKVKVRITKKRRNKIEGKLIEVTEKSPLEKESSCEHFGICGGCSYQNISYDDQLDIKLNQVKESLTNAFWFDNSILPAMEEDY